MRWDEHEARDEVKRNAHKILCLIREGRKTLGRRKNRWVGNIKMNGKGTG
jgi:hypothetical protein